VMVGINSLLHRYRVLEVTKTAEAIEGSPLGRGAASAPAGR
jgi:hypothetical protein